jgi:hypothetical protein
MTIAQHLATIDRLCSQEFPTEHGGSYGAPGGPGYHIVELERYDGFAEGDGGEREEEAEQFEANRDGISQRLVERLGKPEPISLGSHIRTVDLWQPDDNGRWIALGVSQLAEDQEFRLLAIVTETAPP